MAPTVFPQAFTVTLEGPRLQQSSLLSSPSGLGAVNLHQEAFDELPSTFIQTPVPFAANSGLGSYNHVLIRPADAFGGAGGTGKYLTVNANINAADTSTTLTLATPQRYFGLWWSAGDANNVFQFYSGSTLLETFTTNLVVNFINKQPNKSAYFGNPNNGKDTGEPFTFLNFFANPSDPSITFHRVVFTNSGGTGFEQDNHTIASSYIDIVGTAVDTLPALTVGSNQILGLNGGSPSGASLSVAGTTTVGEAGGGNLAVTNGGVLNCGNDVVGNQPDSSGTVTVNGAGSTVNSVGDVIVGNGGQGNLTVINAGTVNAGTPTSTGNVNIANSPGSMGSGSVDGAGSSLTSTGNLEVGNGGNGTLSVTNRGTVTDAGTIVAAQPGSTGSGSVDGAGSSLTSTGNLEVGNGGNGTLSVTNRGTVTDANGTVGSQRGSLGVVTIDGLGSLWNNTGTLTVRPSGTGSLDVTDGGSVTAKGRTVTTESCPRELSQN
jgi:T5SS/PEP-CTERM-associated repeat protein